MMRILDQKKFIDKAGPMGMHPEKSLRALCLEELHALFNALMSLSIGLTAFQKGDLHFILYGRRCEYITVPICR